ncbi:hypothetical protein CHELA1G11_70038 [Hyphomicrobiales bacterium]|jgi:hypothetical protein|nr:hypothetical protein CHELA1G2_60024 [Hyphomicrobiales bacterium]CAH1696932.1 hypothetical protein CHELA1G11_70038 [Hyphomicrobiales bacterium]
MSETTHTPTPGLFRRLKQAFRRPNDAPSTVAESNAARLLDYGAKPDFPGFLHPKEVEGTGPAEPVADGGHSAPDPLPRVPRREAEKVAPVAPVRPASIPVRIATPEDEEGVMELCRLMHAETAFFALDENLVREMMRPSLRQEGGVVCVIGEPGKLGAIINLTFQSHWYSHEMFLTDRMTFVHPDHRNSDHITRLIQYAKTLADLSGCALLLGITSSKRTEAKVRLLRRELGEPVGALFFYDARPRAEVVAPPAQAA